MLADGTQFDRQSGEEHGPNGYWFRWQRLKGKSGKVSMLWQGVGRGVWDRGHRGGGGCDRGQGGELTEQSIACNSNVQDGTQ